MRRSLHVRWGGIIELSNPRRFCCCYLLIGGTRRLVQSFSPQQLCLSPGRYTLVDAQEHLFCVEIDRLDTNHNQIC